MAEKSVAPTTAEASRDYTSDNESMAISKNKELSECQAVQLERNVVNLSIEESMGNQEPMERVEAMGTLGNNTKQPSQLCASSTNLTSNAHSTRGWKRLAREVGKSVQENKARCGFGFEGEKNDFGKRSKSMEIDVELEGKRQCIDNGSQENGQISKVVAGFQHHRSQ